MNKENTRELELTLALLSSLAQEAKAKGLLVPEALESLLRAEIRRRRINRFFKYADRLAAINLPRYHMLCMMILTMMLFWHVQ